MRRLAPRDTTRRPEWTVTRSLTICVIDPNADDYEGWQDTAEARRVRLNFVATAEEALRVARTPAVDMWAVNTDLPGLSGFDLCGMLKERDGRTAVYLVADQYTP